MANNFFSNFFRFALLVFVQVMLLNNIHVTGIFSPYIYPLFILLLPIQTPRWAQLMLAFALGLSIDFFSHTLGLHASATVLMAFLRQPMINVLKPVDGYQPEDRPRISSMGFTWFITYASVLIFVHHLFYFIIETLSFSQFIFVISKIALSTLVSIFIIVTLEYLFYRRRRATA